MTKLDRCWKNQLRMSKAVSGQEGYPDKGWWLKKNHFRKHRENDCFFCQYATDHGGSVGNRGETACLNCPGRLADPRLGMYWCQHERRHWLRDSKAFYRKLVSLNKKRMQNKKTLDK